MGDNERLCAMEPNFILYLSVYINLCGLNVILTEEKAFASLVSELFLNQGFSYCKEFAQ